ncbi:hypothetical protein [Acetobacterium sp.]|uniref:hypothetical protein n=1 Tax=Acetobacterium sp. TaxID=1872094 RepID=UPI0035933376
MKKIGLMLLVLGLMVFGLTGCGIEAYFNNKGNETTVAEKKLPEMVLNEPFLVTTVNGDYSVTINGARSTPERNANSESDPKQVVFLDFTYENISYEKRNNMEFFLAQGDFVVTDEEGNILETYNIKDPNRMIQETTIGGSCSASLAYGLETDSKNITVTFIRGKGKAIAQITVPIE